MGDKLDKWRCKIEAQGLEDKASFAEEREYCPDPEEMGWE